MIQSELISLDLILPSASRLIDWGEECLEGGYPPFPEDEFRRCILQEENKYYERKSECHNFSDPKEKAEFLRDFISFVNSEDPRCRLIFFGIDNEGHYSELEKKFSKHNMSQIITSYIASDIEFELSEASFDDNIIQILVIKPTSDVKCIKKNLKYKKKELLTEGEVWVRSHAGKKRIYGDEIQKLEGVKSTKF